MHDQLMGNLGNLLYRNRPIRIDPALINGDYAILEDENKEQISIARALLPMEIDEGTRLLFKNFQYTIID